MIQASNTNQNPKVRYEGDSDEVIASFPKKVKERFVMDLLFASQNLPTLSDSKPITKGLKNNDYSVFELKKNGKPAYRVVYTRKDGELIVLHAYSKTSDKMPKKEKVTINARLAQL